MDDATLKAMSDEIFGRAGGLPMPQNPSEGTCWLNETNVTVFGIPPGGLGMFTKGVWEALHPASVLNEGSVRSMNRPLELHDEVEWGLRATAPARHAIVMGNMAATAAAPGLASRVNTGKLDYSLIPPEFTALLAAILTQGAQKYAPRNFEKGLPLDDLLRGVESHLQHIKAGELNDADSGLPHAGHAAWGALTFAMQFMRSPALAAIYEQGVATRRTGNMEGVAKQFAQFNPVDLAAPVGVPARSLSQMMESLIAPKGEAK